MRFLLAFVVLPALLQAQTFVWRRDNPPPTSRQEWIFVSGNNPGPGWMLIAGQNPPITGAMALLTADVAKLGADFAKVADRSFQIHRNVQTQALSVGRGNPPYGYQSLRYNLTCEEAFNQAFPGTAATSDCRRINLQSQPGNSIMLTTAGFVSLTGASITLPWNPPITFPPGQFVTPPRNDQDPTRPTFVWRRDNPPPTSRQEWVATSRSNTATAGWTLISPPTANLSAAEASAFADVAKMSANFARVCDRSYNMWRDLESGDLSIGRGPTPWGNQLVSSQMCCEEAFNSAFPGTPANQDCRRINLLSFSGGSIMLSTSGFVSLTGGTVTIPNNPPVVVPPGQFRAWPGSGRRSYFVWRRSTPPASRQEWFAVAKEYPGQGYYTTPENILPISFFAAASLADSLKIGAGFTSVCDRRYEVWQNQQTGALSVLGAGNNAGPGWLPSRSSLCCEEAFNLAFPTQPGLSDCRRLDLQSVPGGSITLTTSGFFSLGPALTIPVNPGITIPGFPFPTPAINLTGLWRAQDGGLYQFNHQFTADPNLRRTRGDAVSATYQAGSGSGALSGVFQGYQFAGNFQSRVSAERTVSGAMRLTYTTEGHLKGSWVLADGSQGEVLLQRTTQQPRPPDPPKPPQSSCESCMRRCAACEGIQAPSLLCVLYGGDQRTQACAACMKSNNCQ